MSAAEEILRTIQKADKPLSVQNIMDRAGFSYTTIATELRILLDKDKIHRVKGQGHSWLYLSGSAPIKKSEDEVDKRRRPNKLSGISNKDLEKFLRVMAKKEWVHPLFNEPLALNRIVLRIYQLAYEKATGSDVEDSDLATERESLELLLEKFQQYTDTLTAILRQGYLWDSETFASWLTENYTTSEIRTMVRQAREHN